MWAGMARCAVPAHVQRAERMTDDDRINVAPLNAALDDGAARRPYHDIAFVALGSNIGDPHRHVRGAIARMRELSAAPLLESSLWETSPVDCPPGSPVFINAVVGLVPCQGESPESLLAKLQALEKEFGRQLKKVLNEPRPLDLDLIAFGDESRNSKELVLPHPRAHQRRFVMEPLREIAPDFILPGQTENVSELLRDLPPDSGMRRIADE